LSANSYFEDHAGLMLRKLDGVMKLVFFVVLCATMVGSQNSTDEATVRKLIQDEITAWNNGNGADCAKHFASDGTFTNIAGMHFTGQNAFRERHEEILKGAYRGSTKHSEIVSIKFVRPDVVIVDTLQTITGFQKLLPGTTADEKGRLRTRLLQVLVKEGGEWKIAAYHNVDVKAGTPVPEPK
jgi:uncharacterized protein (TIGR02246 family)